MRSHVAATIHRYDGSTLCYTPKVTPNGADPNRDENQDGTADECESAGEGSQCDTFNQVHCPIDSVPYDRSFGITHKAVSGLFEGTRVAAHEWDVAER